MSDSLKRPLAWLEAEAGRDEDAGEVRFHVETVEVEPDDPRLKPGGMHVRRASGVESRTDVCVTVVHVRTVAPLELAAHGTEEGPITLH